jgi:HlyD family secretion protein
MAADHNLESDLNTLKIPAELRGAALRRSRGAGRRRLWAATTAAAVAVAILAFMNLRSAPVTVELGRAEISTDQAPAATLVASGYVVPHYQVEVGSKVMGKVAWIGVEKGDQVKRGQLLVRLEEDEYRARVGSARGALATAEATLTELRNGSRPEEIARAQAAMEGARATYERVRELVAAQVVSQQQLDDAKAQYDVALKTYELARLGPRQETIEQARAAVVQAQGDLAYAQTQLEATRITAPIDGTILDRVVETGELVTTMFTGDRGAKSYVVSLADLSDIRVELDINESDFGRVSMDQPCDIVLQAYLDRHYPGRVAEISPEANREKGTVQVKVQILKPDSFVRPQMLARVSFQRAAPDSRGQGEAPSTGAAPAVTIPRSARVERNGRSAVFVVQEGRARLQEIQTNDPGGDLLVVTQGLAGGESVVVNAPPALEDGTRVTVSASSGGAG